VEEGKSGRVFGYARVSTKEQNLDRQLEALKKYVPDESILIDKASGKDTDRPGYQALKGALGLREGDTLYITSLDRLSRSKQDIKTELQWFHEKRIRLKILDLPTSMVEVPEGQEWIIDMISNILVEVLSSIAESDPLWEMTGSTLVMSSSENTSVCIVSSRASILSTFPLIVLISPLWTMSRLGCARFQLGMVFVEKRECTMAMADL
jgi:hypothetical protein